MLESRSNVDHTAVSGDMDAVRLLSVIHRNNHSCRLQEVRVVALY
jgi:hypothetical protein